MTEQTGDTSPDTSLVGKIASLFDGDLNIAPDAVVPDALKIAEKDRSPAPAPKPKEKTPPAEEVDEDDSDEEPEVDDEDEDPAPVVATKRKLKVGEEELEEDEVVKGYLRQSDYTRKTQDLAAQRKKLETEELPKVAAAEKAYAERLKTLDEAIRASTPQEPDWDVLRKTAKPEEFNQTFAEWSIHKQRMEKLAEARRQADATVQENERAEGERRGAANAERLLELIPDWKDEATSKREADAIAKMVEPLGITRQELGGIQKPELFVLLRKALQYDTLRAEVDAGKVKAVKKAPTADTTLAPTNREDERTPASKDTDKKFKRAAKSGRVEDAAAVLRDMLD